ncbi:MAG TPA: LppP/LprE family lipoprotein [Solirubrobacteraceae bacterium]|nr:LppP/LprE family lipoprotein [Solirubrobacteraceae bacterium]
MRRSAPTATALLMGACAALAAGCGSGTKTVSVGGAPPEQTTSATSTIASTAKPPAATASTPATAPPSATHTAPAPAFTREGAGASSQSAPSAQLAAALALVRSKGYTASESSEYHADQTLRVLIGTRTGSGDGYGQQAFFFVDGSYIGTDAAQPSATLKVVSQGDTEVVLAYPLYRKGDPLSHPSGGQATVRFQLNDGQLAALGKIPPVSSEGGLSRQ